MRYFDRGQQRDEFRNLPTKTVQEKASAINVICDVEIVEAGDLTEAERAGIPGGWVEAVSASTIEESARIISDEWRKYCPALTKIPVYLENNLLGLKLARARKMRGWHANIYGEFGELEVVLVYFFPYPSSLETSDYTTYYGLVPVGEESLPEYWHFMEPTFGQLPTKLHDGFVNAWGEGVVSVKNFVKFDDYYGDLNVALVDEDRNHLPDECFDRQIFMMFATSSGYNCMVNSIDGTCRFGFDEFKLVDMTKIIEDFIANIGLAHEYNSGYRPHYE